MCCLTSHGDGGGFDLNRREFLCTLGGTAAGVGLGATGSAAPAPAAKPEPIVPRERDVPLVRAVYLRPRGKYWLGWPGTAFDIEGHCRDYNAKLQAFGKELGVKVEIENEPVYDDAGMNQFLAKIGDERPHGVIVFPLHMNQWGPVDKIAQFGLPTIVFAGLGVCFTGHIQRISKLPKVYLASTGNFDLSAAKYGMRMVKTAHQMQSTRILVLRGNRSGERKLEPLGTTLHIVPRDRFADEFKAMEETDEMRAIAEDYARKAQKIVEPTEADRINAARTYLVAKKMMREEGCQAITMDCLGLVAERKLPTPPCMGWSKLLDEGTCGCCEADIEAANSLLLTSYLLGKPGFMQDPVPETVSNTFIGAHCVAPSRLNGFDQPPEPFILRSHSESDIGVSLQVLWRPGHDVTIMKFQGTDRMIIGSGKVLKNHDTPPAGGCRTSVELEIDGPPDTRDTKGFHQLFLYGDHARQLHAYCQMYGIAGEHI